MGGFYSYERRRFCDHVVVYTLLISAVAVLLAISAYLYAIVPISITLAFYCVQSNSHKALKSVLKTRNFSVSYQNGYLSIPVFCLIGKAKSVLVERKQAFLKFHAHDVKGIRVKKYRTGGNKGARGVVSLQIWLQFKYSEKFAAIGDSRGLIYIDGRFLGLAKDRVVEFLEKVYAVDLCVQLDE